LVAKLSNVMLHAKKASISDFLVWIPFLAQVSRLQQHHAKTALVPA